MRYSTVQILENGIPIDHKWNREWQEGGESSMADNARVKYSTGITINIGNYQSARVDVGIEVPCENSEEGIEKSYTNASNWASNKLLDEMNWLADLKKSVK